MRALLDGMLELAAILWIGIAPFGAAIWGYRKGLADGMRRLRFAARGGRDA